MSAIMGTVRWDGAPADLAGVEAMGRALRHRGEGPPRFWHRGPAALGHCLLPTTPQADAATQPLWASAEGVAITADARLDNRDGLLAELDLDKDAGDDAVILRAYLRWGEGCAERLLGDFAFALWDAPRRRLVCARDHFGVRPLFYVRRGDAVAFASESTALLHFLPGLAAEVDPEVVGSFLTGMVVDREDTFYRHVKRVRPAHVATFGAGAARTRRYYEFQTAGAVPRRREESAEHFRKLFTRAVARRVRGPRRVGCLLSGGLDSSSVACVARDHVWQAGQANLFTYTNRYPDSPECDEAVYLQAVLDQGGFAPHFQAVNTTRTLADLDALVATLGTPTTGLGVFTNEPLYPLIRATGVNTVLDGHGGDEVVSEVPAILREMAARSRWLAFTRAWVPVARGRQVPVWPPIRDCVFSSGFVGRWRRRWRLGQRLAAWRGRGPALPPPARPRWAEQVDGRFLPDTELRARRALWWSDQPDSAPSAQEAHRRRVFNTAQGLAFEALDAVSARSAVEARYPFWDKDVVEFCLTIPPSHKLAHGLDRGVLRGGLRGILPEAVRRRPGKTSFAPQAVRAFASLARGDLDALWQPPDRSGDRFVDTGWCQDAVARLHETGRYDDLPRLWLAVAVLAWLRHARREAASGRMQ